MKTESETNVEAKSETKTPVSNSNLTDIESARARNVLSPFDEMDKLFDQYLLKPWSPFKFEMPEWSTSLQKNVPRVDIMENDSKVVVTAEIPGVDKKDLDISITENTIYIKGHTMDEKKEEDGVYYRREIKRGSFVRTLSFPCDVESSKAKASFKDGVLEVTIPKMKESYRHKVEIK